MKRLLACAVFVLIAAAVHAEEPRIAAPAGTDATAPAAGLKVSVEMAGAEIVVTLQNTTDKDMTLDPPGTAAWTLTVREDQQPARACVIATADGRRHDPIVLHPDEDREFHIRVLTGDEKPPAESGKLACRVQLSSKTLRPFAVVTVTPHGGPAQSAPRVSLDRLRTLDDAAVKSQAEGLRAAVKRYAEAHKLNFAIADEATTTLTGNKEVVITISTKKSPETLDFVLHGNTALHSHYVVDAGGGGWNITVEQSDAGEWEVKKCERWASERYL
jgi:hypothetical protein